ncbi:uncharacterized protein LOC110265344 [Arachis ipaensis]|nr:uncharacterized protein LOC110265344 [Arachis ipaensis]XP_025670480.1 uncharacterized protein LOC112770319 [Arachis hypogaea]
MSNEGESDLDTTKSQKKVVLKPQEGIGRGIRIVNHNDNNNNELIRNNINQQHHQHDDLDNNNQKKVIDDVVVNDGEYGRIQSLPYKKNRPYMCSKCMAIGTQKWQSKSLSFQIKGNVKSTSRDEDEVLSQILGSGREEKAPSSQKSICTASSSSYKPDILGIDDSDIQQFVSNDKPDILGIDVGSTTPDELRQQALEEKRKYKILKGDGKSEEALRSFTRGKELEGQADSLEIHLRKNRKKITKMLSSGNLSDMHNKGSPKEVGSKTKSLPHPGKEKDDLMSELRELGWSDMDLHCEDRKPASLSLEGELSSIIGKVRPKTGEEKGSRIDKTEVVALKRKDLTLKREGRLAEAKEELKELKFLKRSWKNRNS